MKDIVTYLKMES